MEKKRFKKKKDELMTVVGEWTRAKLLDLGSSCASGVYQVHMYLGGRGRYRLAGYLSSASVDVNGRKSRRN